MVIPWVLLLVLLQESNMKDLLKQAQECLSEASGINGNQQVERLISLAESFIMEALEEISEDRDYLDSDTHLEQLI